jgi:hypothetical protein
MVVVTHHEATFQNQERLATARSALGPSADGRTDAELRMLAAHHELAMLDATAAPRATDRRADLQSRIRGLRAVIEVERETVAEEQHTAAAVAGGEDSNGETARAPHRRPEDGAEGESRETADAAAKSLRAAGRAHRAHSQRAAARAERSQQRTAAAVEGGDGDGETAHVPRRRPEDGAEEASRETTDAAARSLRAAGRAHRARSQRSAARAARSQQRAASGGDGGAREAPSAPPAPRRTASERALSSSHPPPPPGERSGTARSSSSSPRASSSSSSPPPRARFAVVIMREARRRPPPSPAP